MKSINKGKFILDFPYCYEWTCYRCGQTVQLEQGDAFDYFDDQRDPSMSITCPTCKQKLTFYQGRRIDDAGDHTSYWDR